MKCPWCGTKIESEHQIKERWVRGSKSGQGFYRCPRCAKSLVHRYEINLSVIVALFLVGAASTFIPIVVEVIFKSVFGFGEDLSGVAGLAFCASLIGALWYFSFQPVDVKPE